VEIMNKPLPDHLAQIDPSYAPRPAGERGRMRRRIGFGVLVFLLIQPLIAWMELDAGTSRISESGMNGPLVIEATYGERAWESFVPAWGYYRIRQHHQGFSPVRVHLSYGNQEAQRMFPGGTEVSSDLWWVNVDRDIGRIRVSFSVDGVSAVEFQR
jgi:hypothetical protein